MAVKLRVDPIMCDGFGFCAELAPELIDLDEWGYPIITEAVLNRFQRDLAEETILACPRKALSLQVVDVAPRDSPRG